MAVLSGLKPESVFKYFEALCSVPHGSGNTKQISDLCVSYAKKLGLRYRQEPCNNVIIWKDGSAGYEDAAPIMLQGHIDMVCAKTDDCTKDMAKDGLDLRTDGEWVWADKTSLGGDNGIAVAMILAILEDETMPHPPIEAVFTVEEEVGMDGAFALDCSDLKSRKLLNLDSEEEGVFTVSCAGGLRLDCVMPGKAQPLKGETGYHLTLAGLQGGHSGGEIDKGRGSANQLMGRVLYSAMEKFPGLRLADIRGGRFDNVICPRNEAEAAIPGVQAMNVDFPGLVQTSLNLGVMSVEEDGLHFAFSIRSCIASQKDMMEQRVRSVVEYAGGTAHKRSSYPGWQYARQSQFREMILQAYHDTTGKVGGIAATHGGLECGLFIEKMPGLDAVSMGPELHDVHSVRERLNVPSTQRTYELVCEILKRSR